MPIREQLKILRDKYTIRLDNAKQAVDPGDIAEWGGHLSALEDVEAVLTRVNDRGEHLVICEPMSAFAWNLLIEALEAHMKTLTESGAFNEMQRVATIRRLLSDAKMRAEDLDLQAQMKHNKDVKR